jgi:hypothetical protein
MTTATMAMRVDDVEDVVLAVVAAEMTLSPVPFPAAMPFSIFAAVTLVDDMPHPVIVGVGEAVGDKDVDGEGVGDVVKRIGWGRAVRRTNARSASGGVAHLEPVMHRPVVQVCTVGVTNP